MSIKSWKKEFYPKKADRVKGEKASIDHSVLKWTGLLKKNLAKHKLIAASHCINDTDGDSLAIDISTCALCQNYYDEDDECSECPYTEMKGRACYVYGIGDFDQWVINNDARPMLRSLKVLQKKYRKESEK